jgi:hypothetical protein
MSRMLELTQQYTPQGPPKATSLKMDADTKEKLRSLGYLK